MKTRMNPVALSGPLLLLSLAYFPLHAAPPADPAPASPTTATAEFNGLKVGIDPRTGKLRPLSAEESRQLEQMLIQQRRATPARNARGLAALPATEAEAVGNTRTLPGGGSAMKVPASQMSELVAHRNADGSLSIEHADDADTHAPQTREGQSHD